MSGQFVLLPALLAGEIFFPLLGEEEKLLSAIETALDTGFYRRLEVALLSGQDLRARTRSLGVPLSVWCTANIAGEGLHPATTDPALRGKTIAGMCRFADIAAEMGGDSLNIVSGPDPGEESRAEAHKGMVEVMCRVALHMKQYPGMRLLIEPLDRDVHKKNFIGPTLSALNLLREVQAATGNGFISWDSAHTALNREDLGESLAQSAEYIGHLHLANAVLDPGNPGYGDWHMPMGAPGFLTVEEAARLLQAAAELTRSRTAPLCVSVECRCPEGLAPLVNEAENRSFLLQAMELSGMKVGYGNECEKN